MDSERFLSRNGNPMFRAHFTSIESEVLFNALARRQAIGSGEAGDSEDQPFFDGLATLPDSGGINLIMRETSADSYLDGLAEAVNSYHVGLRTGRVPAEFMPKKDLRKSLLAAMDLSRRLGQTASDLRGDWIHDG